VAVNGEAANTPETGGSLPSGARRGPWPRYRLLIAVAVVALAGVVVVAVNRNHYFRSPNGAAPTAATADSTTPSAAAPKPVCLPTITETGFSVIGHDVYYGVIARSDCPQATYNNVVFVRVLDAAGNQIEGQNDYLPEMVVLLPGQEVGGAGSFYLKTVTTVSKVEVKFTAASAAPVSAFASWPTSVQVTDLNISKPDAVGRTTVTGQIVTEPPGAYLCSPRTSLILRDATGKIIYGLAGQPRANTVYFDLAMPANADLSRTTVYVALGQAALSLNPVATAACRA
jgi:hypothetical protein